MNTRCLLSLALLSVVLLLPACAVTPRGPPKQLLELTEAQLKTRSFQMRSFDVGDENKVLRGVVAALQDLGFIIERANGSMGMITAGKFGPGGRGFVAVTVIVRAKGETQSEVRVTALYNTKPIEDPEIYRNFFRAVSRAMFVTQALSEPTPTEAE